MPSFLGAMRASAGPDLGSKPDRNAGAMFAIMLDSLNPSCSKIGRFAAAPRHRFQFRTLPKNGKIKSIYFVTFAGHIGMFLRCAHWYV
jgi:hypothetical protein